VQLTSVKIYEKHWLHQGNTLQHQGSVKYGVP